MAKQFDVLVIGELNVDLILNQIGKLPEIGKEILADQMTLTLGSSSAIFASNLSTLGTKVTFAGKLGHDNFGDHIIASLNARGVDTRYIIRSVKHTTGATIVLNYGEDRAMVTYQGSMKYLTLHDIPEVVFSKSRHLHLSSVFLQTGLVNDLVYLFQKAKSQGLTTSIDPQWDPAETWKIDLEKLLPHVDVFLPNVKELCALTGTNHVEDGLEVLKPHANVVVVKNGSEGAWLFDGKELIHQPSFRNKHVVDSIGAGDSFDSGFIHKYLLKKSLRECLEFGALTGAINTTRAGGTTAFENLNLVKTIAGSSFNYVFHETSGKA
jgi:sugar/nucleoside kinase (ribokinase family)